MIDFFLSCLKATKAHKWSVTACQVRLPPKQRKTVTKIRTLFDSRSLLNENRLAIAFDLLKRLKSSCARTTKPYHLTHVIYFHTGFIPVDLLQTFPEPNACCHLRRLLKVAAQAQEMEQRLWGTVRDYRNGEEEPDGGQNEQTGMNSETRESSKRVTCASLFLRLFQMAPNSKKYCERSCIFRIRHLTYITRNYTLSRVLKNCR